MTIDQEEAVESSFLERSVEPSVGIRGLLFNAVVVDDYCDFFYLISSPWSFHSLFQLLEIYVDYPFILITMSERCAILHDEIDRFDWLSEKLLPEVDLPLFPRRENRTKHQQASQSQNGNFCFHINSL